MWFCSKLFELYIFKYVRIYIFFRLIWLSLPLRSFIEPFLFLSIGWFGLRLPLNTIPYPNHIIPETNILPWQHPLTLRIQPLNPIHPLPLLPGIPLLHPSIGSILLAHLLNFAGRGEITSTAFTFTPAFVQLVTHFGYFGCTVLQIHTQLFQYLTAALQ